MRGRLARARERLRVRLTRRGVEVPAILEASRPTNAALVLRPGLAQAAARAALRFEASGATGPGAISRSVISLSERTCRTMLLNRLKAVAAALVLGVVAAGAVVSAQQPAGGPGEKTARVATPRRPPQTVPGKGGNLAVDWIPDDGKGGKKEITVDPKRHCIHLLPMSLKRDDRPNDGAVRLDLDHGKTYTVTASGEAFMGAETGVNADPYPGVVVLYGTDEEDGYAIRQTVLAPGKSITFRSPWNIYPKDDVYLMAFFLDIWPNDPKRGSYTLTVEETGEPAVGEHAIKAPFDVIIKQERVDAKALYDILIKKEIGESDAAFTKRALEAARKVVVDPKDPASPARRAGTVRRKHGTGGGDRADPATGKPPVPDGPQPK